MFEDASFNFNEALKIEPVYRPSELFFSPFYIFHYRLFSLQRYNWFINKYISWYLDSTKNINTGSEESRFDNFSLALFDMVLSDREYFPQYLRGSVSVHIFSLIESLLKDIVDDTIEKLPIFKRLSLPNNPGITEHINFLQYCGLKIRFDEEIWNQLQILRRMRNIFAHEIGRDNPYQTKSRLNIDDSFIDRAFNTAGEIAATLESAYWNFHDQEIKSESE